MKTICSPYPSLWHSLIMAGDNAVEAHPQDKEELQRLREIGIATGKKWIRLTDYGKKIREAALLEAEESTCGRCLGSGSYRYDHNHWKPCERCCKHENGWWRVTEHYAGYIAESDNFYCMECGQMRGGQS